MRIASILAIALVLTTFKTEASRPLSSKLGKSLNEREAIMKAEQGQTDVLTAPGLSRTASTRADDDDRPYEYGKPVYTLPEGGTAKTYNRSCSYIYYDSWNDGLVLTTEGEFAGEVVFYDNGDVYFKDMIPSMVEGTYLLGKLEGSKITMEFPQVLCYEEAYDDGTGNIVTDGFWPVFKLNYEMTDYTIETEIDDENPVITFTLSDDGGISMDPDQGMIGVCTQYGLFYGESAWDYVYVPFADEPVVMPEGLTIETWSFSDWATSLLCDVAFDGTDVYVRGFYSSIPDGTIKGYIGEDGNVHFPSVQYLGVSNSTGLRGYFYGTKLVDGWFVFDDEYVFSYDASEGQMTGLQSNMLINEGTEAVSAMKWFYYPVLKRQENGPVIGKPATPSFVEMSEYEYNIYTDKNEWYVIVSIPNVDVDGNILDEDNLYYQFFFDDELFIFDMDDYSLTADATDVPYNFSDGWNISKNGGYLRQVWFYFEGFNKMGVQSFIEDPDNGYEAIYSEIAEVVYGGVDGVTDDTASKGVAAYYDLLGRKVSNPAGGIFIRMDSDGKAVKVMK